MDGRFQSAEQQQAMLTRSVAGWESQGGQAAKLRWQQPRSNMEVLGVAPWHQRVGGATNGGLVVRD